MATLWILLRALHFAAVMLLTGSACYSALLAPKRYRPLLALRLNPLVKGSAWLALLSALAMLGCQNVLMSGDSTNLADIDIWQAVLGTHFGAVWQWEIIFGVLAVVALLLTGRLRQQVLLLAGVLQLACMALIGHAAMRDGWPGLLQQINQAMHLIAAAFWVGGLLPLLLLMHEARQIDRRTDAIRTMMRFSRYGHLAVALTLLSGVINSVMIAGWPFMWHDSRYIILLLCKVLLVALMVLVALINRYWLVPRFRVAGSGTQQKFIRMTQLELLLACGVVGLVSVFATLSPA
ncbi:putative copper resistance protein D [Candidatus Pantoea varia]|uniref:Copper resistance protein D n=1 Tax=Candidatus Pantoea varia TaxID=1881036 RepID=A0A1I4XLD6_9GAMM|nr:copper homeostasis membrane protein CopD [Pantoea varia]SFN26624.1 putative copper resistance protein D [Pantoea varia]